MKNKSSTGTEILDERFEKLRKHLRLFDRPHKGWIKAIREALGMRSRQLGDRMKVSRQRIEEIEKNEILNKLTLETVQRVAEALDCEFVYALIPAKSLKETLEERAILVAKGLTQRTEHSMNLEGQSNLAAFQKQLGEQLSKGILQGIFQGEVQSNLAAFQKQLGELSMAILRSKANILWNEDFQK